MAALQTRWRFAAKVVLQGKSGPSENLKKSILSTNPAQPHYKIFWQSK